MKENSTPRDKDPKLWEIAGSRADFKTDLFSYIVMNAFFWIIWYFTQEQGDHEGWPWPLWVTLGWGIGIAFHFYEAYINPEGNSVEKEYEKLTNKENK